MNFDFSILISNPLINVGVVSWMVAQLLKTIIHLFTKGEFKRERLAGAGGMPSSHSAVTCSVLLLSYLLYGFDSPIFAMAFILALIVMYDATGVRWAAGLHAKAINYIVERQGQGPAQRDDPEAERVARPPDDRGRLRRGARLCDRIDRLLLLLRSEASAFLYGNRGI